VRGREGEIKRGFVREKSTPRRKKTLFVQEEKKDGFFGVRTVGGHGRTVAASSIFSQGKKKGGVS